MDSFGPDVFQKSEFFRFREGKTVHKTCITEYGRVPLMPHSINKHRISVLNSFTRREIRRVICIT